MTLTTPSEVTIGGKRLKLVNLDKVFYPAVGFTKGQVIDYYARISSVLLPHLKDRPLTLKRYPDGVEGPFFYEKRCPEHRPKWVQTAPVWSDDKGDHIQFCLANDLATLIWAANLADLELHTSLSLAKKIEQPTMMVFDLDPGEPADIRDCCAVAAQLRALLEQLRLKSFAKTSGSKGLQVYVPLNTPVTYDETKPFSHAIAQVLERANPKGVTSNMSKSLRRGRVFVDWSQNDEHKTTVCVYSLRAKERPTVSTPVDWDEVQQGIRPKKGKELVFESQKVLERAERRGDVFEAVLELKQRLPALNI
jgi:bifunctional non-homologous end joining protein LigD